MKNDFTTGVYSSINHLTLELLRKVINENTLYDIRGSKVKRIRNVAFTLTDPTKRLMSLKHRGNNLPATIAEILWILAGTNELRFLHKYLPRVTEYSDDYKLMTDEYKLDPADSLNTATWLAGYGQRIFNFYGMTDQKFVNQYEMVKTTLLSDPLSRRAFITIPDPKIDDKRTNDRLDVPCTMSLIFTSEPHPIRENTYFIDLNVTMRSNDLIFGLSNINVPEFTVLQELLVFELNRHGRATFILGKYYHTSVDLQVYEKHFERSNRILSEYERFLSYNYDESISVLKEDEYENIPITFYKSNWTPIFDGFKCPPEYNPSDFSIVLFRIFSLIEETDNKNFFLKWFKSNFTPDTNFDYLSFYVLYMASYYFKDPDILKNYLEEYKEHFYPKYDNALTNIYFPKLISAIEYFK